MLFSLIFKGANLLSMVNPLAIKAQYRTFPAQK